MPAAEIGRLYASLDGLALPADPNTIIAAPLPSSPTYFVGRTHHGHACALVQTPQGRGGADVRLRNLEVAQGVRCRVARPSGGEDLVLGSLVVCRSDDPRMIGLFLRLLGDAVEQLGAGPTPREVANWVQALSTLFSRLEGAGRKQLRGLWAELLVIIDSPDPVLFLRRWHPNPNEQLDFLGAGFAVEVKSCRDLERVHEFSLAQLRPPPDVTTWIASVPVREDPHGTSVLDLLALLETELPTPEARATARSIVLETAGQSLEEDSHHRFDLQMARAGLRFVDACAVPSISGEPPKEVLEVRLSVRCRDVPSAGTSADAAARLEQ